MTLSGTMEAFNVPDKSSPTHESSITTFLEGEIIDFNTYTLETKSFNADPRVDGTYWRKLPPFKELTDDEMVRNLVSKRWLREELGMKWILMRWKGTILPLRSACCHHMLIEFRHCREVLRNTIRCAIFPHHQRILLRLSAPLRRACRGPVL